MVCDVENQPCTRTQAGCRMLQAMNPAGPDFGRIAEGESGAAALPPSAVGPHSSPAGPVQVPDHQLVRVIGRGSYGEVWLARNKLGTMRAIKVVHRAAFEDARPFEREFKGIQKFEPISRSHEGLVDILQVGGTEEYFYYVMELADPAEPRLSSSEFRVLSSAIAAAGDQRETQNSEPETYSPHTLRSDLKRHGRLPVAECVRIGLSLADGLAHLHQHSLVHRDIKPSNIIFVGGVPKLADIGLVADVGEARSFVGTQGFIPPEGPGTPQADLFSLGKVLYELSTGKDRHDYPELPDNLRDLPDQGALIELNAVLVRACAADPRRRYRFAEELHADLALLQRGKSVKRKRTMLRCWGMARSWGLAAILLTPVVANVSFNKLFNRGRAPNPEAVRLFDLARWYHNKYTDDARAKAVEYLNQAVQIDPEYAAAYGLLFELHVWDINSEEKWRKSRELAAKLMALDPKRAEAHSALSWVRYGGSDWRGAEQEIRTAIQLNPNYPMARCIYGYYLSLLGRVEEAVPQLQRAQELDPTSRLYAIVAAFPFIVARQYDQAIAQMQTPLNLDPHFPLAHQWLARIYEAKGDYLLAITEYEKLDRLTGAGEAQVLGEYEAFRQAFKESGARGYWLKALDLQQSPGSLLDRKVKPFWGSRYDLAEIYAQLGEKERALDLLEKDFVQGGPGRWLNLLPLYEPLRAEPRFKALLKKAGLDG